MITGIHLVAPGDDLESKLCPNHLFKRTFSGVSYSFTKKKTTGKKKNKSTISTVQVRQNPISGSHFADSVKLCAVQRKKSFLDTYIGVGKGKNLSCGDSLVPCSKEASQTICVDPADYESECPITDVKIVLNEDYDAEQLKGYTKAEISGGGDDLTWALYYSKSYPGLPISTFRLTQNVPCSVDKTYITTDSKNIEKSKWISNDKFSLKCAAHDIDSEIQKSFRTLSTDVSVNEYEFLQKTGIIKAIDKLEKLPGGLTDFGKARAKNDLILWQRPLSPCRSSCDSINSLADFNLKVKEILASKQQIA